VDDSVSTDSGKPDMAVLGTFDRWPGGIAAPE
jgi:hypothetical protein